MDGPRDSVPGRIVPEEIQCAEHGSWHRVERQSILRHENGSLHVYAMATCQVRGGPKHSFAEYVRRADQP